MTNPLSRLWAKIKPRKSADQVIDKAMTDAARAHHMRRYSREHPADNARDQWIADNMPDRFRSADGDIGEMK